MKDQRPHRGFRSGGFPGSPYGNYPFLGSLKFEDTTLSLLFGRFPET